MPELSPNPYEALKRAAKNAADVIRQFGTTSEEHLAVHQIEAALREVEANERKIDEWLRSLSTSMPQFDSAEVPS